MPEPRQQLQDSAAVTLPIGPLSLSVNGAPAGTIFVSDATPPVVTLSFYGNDVYQSSDANFSNNLLAATFTDMELQGSFTDQTTGSGNLEYPGTSTQAAWSASVPVVQMPVTQVPLRVLGSNAGTLTITPGQMSIDPGNSRAPIRLGNPGSAFNPQTGKLAQFNFSSAVTINDVSYTGMSGFFLSNLYGSGLLIRSDGNTDPWSMQPTLGLPTPILDLTIGTTRAGRMRILNSGVMQFMPAGGSAWQTVVTFGNHLSQQSGSIAPTAIDFSFGTNTTYTSIAGQFTTSVTGSGSLGSALSPTSGEDTWTAESGTGEP